MKRNAGNKGITAMFNKRNNSRVRRLLRSAMPATAPPDFHHLNTAGGPA